MKMPKPEGGDYEPCPAGNQLAVCSRLIDLGTQETTFNGQAKRQHKLYIEFQVPGERNSEGEPFVVGNRYTFSSSEKATLRNISKAGAVRNSATKRSQISICGTYLQSPYA